MSPAQKTAGVSPRLIVLAVGAACLVILALHKPARAPSTAPIPERPLPTRLEPGQLSRDEAERESPVVSGYKRDIARPVPVHNARSEAPAGDASSEDRELRPGSKKTGPAALPEIFRMPPEPASTRLEPEAGPEHSKAAPPWKPSRGFAPFGRMIKCQLVEALDSITARSEPIVALVTEDLDWNGQVIVPAGTEAFGYALSQAVVGARGVGRLIDSGQWTLVLPGERGRPNGRELAVRARAIDRSERAPAVAGDPVAAWGLDDGADGLIGSTVSTLDNEEVKLFVAAAVGGMAQGFAAIAERQQASPGLAGALGATQIAPTLGNAAIGAAGTGAADLMNQMASRIRDEISKRGVYVRVPAGKTFYLFVEQTIDPAVAAVGLKFPGNETSR